MGDSDDGVGFDLFAEGDAVENFREAAGLPADDGAAASAEPAAEPAAAAAAAPPPAECDVSGGAALVVLAAACACLARPVPKPVAAALEGLWMTRCGNKLRVRVTKQRRAEVVTMGTYTIPILGAIPSPPAAAGAAAASPPSREEYEVGDKVRYQDRAYYVERVRCEGEENLVMLARDLWVPAGEVARAAASPMRGALKPRRDVNRPVARKGGVLKKFIAAAQAQGVAMREAKAQRRVGDAVVYRDRPYTVAAVPPPPYTDVALLPLYKKAKAAGGGGGAAAEAKWVPQAKVVPLEFHPGDAVRVVVAEGGERHPGMVLATAPVFKVALQHVEKPVVVQRVSRVAAEEDLQFMGARILPTSDGNTLRFSDGDEWQRVRHRRMCPACHVDLRFTTAFPADYGDVYYCSLCGEPEAKERGGFHCGQCFFDVCCGCIEHLTVQYPPDPPPRVACGEVKCSLCDAGPFSLDDAYGHWLYMCPRNPYRAYQIAGGGVCASVKKLRRIHKVQPPAPPPPQPHAVPPRPQAAWADGLVDGDGNAVLRDGDTPPDTEGGDLSQLTSAQKRSIHTLCYLTDSVEGVEEAVAKNWQQLPLKELVRAPGTVVVSNMKIGVQVVKRTRDGEYGPEEYQAIIPSGRGEPAPPLFFACLNARADLVKWLLLHGADPTQALHCMLDGKPVTPITVARRAGFAAFENMLCGAVLARTPLAIKVVDKHGETHLTCPADAAGRRATTLTQRLVKYVSNPSPDGLAAKVEYFPRFAPRPSSFAEPEEPVSVTGGLQAFANAVMRDGGDPLPSELQAATVQALQRRLKASKVVAALGIALGAE